MKTDNEVDRETSPQRKHAGTSVEGGREVTKGENEVFGYDIHFLDGTVLNDLCGSRTGAL